MTDLAKDKAEYLRLRQNLNLPEAATTETLTLEQVSTDCFLIAERLGRAMAKLIIYRMLYDRRPGGLAVANNLIDEARNEFLQGGAHPDDLSVIMPVVERALAEARGQMEHLLACTGGAA